MDSEPTLKCVSRVDIVAFQAQQTSRVKRFFAREPDEGGQEHHQNRVGEESVEEDDQPRQHLKQLHRNDVKCVAAEREQQRCARSSYTLFFEEDLVLLNHSLSKTL